MTDCKPKKWTLTILDSDDGTGDGIVTLPDDLLAESGWREGDTLEIETTPDGRVYVYRSLTAAEGPLTGRQLPDSEP